MAGTQERDWKQKLQDEKEEMELKAKAKGKEVLNDLKDSSEKVQNDIKNKFNKK